MKKEERPKQNYINFGSSVRPVGSLRQIQPFLDAKVYNIDVLPMSGPVLEIVDNIDLSVPERVYGDIMARVDKSFEAYGYRDRNTGILLSGERGMGKTLFIRIAINRALGMGMPVIMLKKTDALSGIIETINSITQPVLVIMDEFEKNFKIDRSEGSDESDGSQMEFLTMLDGLGSCEKRMFIASVNDTDKLNEFLLNRPGRFYYHFEFPPLSDKECTEYLMHETKGVSKKDIKYAVVAMQNYNINYDCLAAIASEISHKRSIDDTLRDLNLDRHGNSEYAVYITINGHDYSGILEYSLSQLQECHSRRTLYLYSVNPCPPKAKRVSTGFLGTSVNITVNKFTIEMTKDGEIQFPIDATNFVELYCPDGDVSIPDKKDDDGDNYYIILDELKSISKVTLKPMKRERSALYLRKAF